MKYLVIVRHALYDERAMRLKPAGVIDMQRLGDQLEQIARECRRTRGGIDIISSSSFRAIESAIELAARMSLEHVRSFRPLYSDRETLDVQAALAVIKQVGDEIPKGLLVVVTHDELACDLLTAILRELGIAMRPKGLSKGEACIINTDDKRVSFIAG